MWVLLLLAILLPLCVSLSIILIHVNAERVRIADDPPAWRNPEYRQELPNLLGLMREMGWRSPWPRRDGVCSIYWYEWKLRRLVPNTSTPAFRLIGWHLNCWFHLRKYKPLLDLALAASKVDVALALAQAGEGIERERYRELIGVWSERHHRLKKMVLRQFGPSYLARAEPLLQELKRIEIIFDEHGYHVHEGFAGSEELEGFRTAVQRISG